MCSTIAPFPRGRTASAGWWLVVLLASGCARNAALEVTFDLPPAPTVATTRRTYAFAQFDRPPASFDTSWSNTSDFDGVELGPARSFARYSLLTERIDGDLLVKLRFCASPRCDDDGDENAPSELYVIERPFHLGQRTAWTAVVQQVPGGPDTMPTVVDRCAVSGCILGYRGAVSYCREDGSHFCDPAGTVPAIDGGARDAAVRDAGRGDAASDAAMTEER
jgi:hypothetical protein